MMPSPTLTPPNSSSKVETQNRVLGSLRKMGRFSHLRLLFRSPSAQDSPQRLPKSFALPDKFFDDGQTMPIPEYLMHLPESIRDPVEDLMQPPPLRDSSYYKPRRGSRYLSHRSSQITPEISSVSEFPSPLAKKNYASHICCICREPLALALAGEQAVVMSCEHLCHSECEALASKCTSCATETDDSEIANILSISAEFGSDKMGSTVVSFLSSKGSAPITPEDQVLKPVDQPEVAETPKAIVESRVMWPQVTTLCIMSDKQYIFEIKAPLVNTITDTLPPDTGAVSTVVRQAIESWLSRSVANWANSFSTSHPHGHLLMLDNLQVTTNGIDWDTLAVYCFENVLVLTTNDNSMVGQIWIKDDISSINSLPGCTILNLVLEDIPEIQFKQEPLVMARWKELLQRLKRLQRVSSNVYQLTTTAWKFIESLVKLPQDVASYAQDIGKEQERALPANLARAMLASEVRSLNLILLLSVVNTSRMLDDDYRSKLVEIIYDALDQLRSQDKLSLVLVGVDGEGRAGRTGRFVGFIGAEWDGWQKVIDDIEVIPNDCCIEYPEIFPSDWYELSTSIEKCLALIPFLPSESNSFNKLLIATTAGNNSKPRELEIDACRDKLIRGVLALTKQISMSIMVVGCGTSTDGSDFTAQQISVAGSRANLSCRMVNTLIVSSFDSMDSMRSHIHNSIVRHWQRVIIPQLMLELDIPSPHTAELMDQLPAISPTEPGKSIALSKSLTRLIIPDVTGNHFSSIKLQIGSEAIKASSYCLSWGGNTTQKIHL